MASLSQIARALSVSPAELLAEGEQPRPRQVSRAEELAALLDGLTDDEATRVLGIVREVRGLLTKRRSRRS